MKFSAAPRYHRHRLCFGLGSRRRELKAGRTLILRDDGPREVIVGSVDQLHRIDQRPLRFASSVELLAFDDPQYEELFMSIRLAPSGPPRVHAAPTI